jgi:hypothetical protein
MHTLTTLQAAGAFVTFVTNLLDSEMNNGVG